MATDGTGRFEIPEARDAVSIEGTLSRLRKDIVSECSSLLRRTDRASKSEVIGDRAVVWKSRINRILEVKETTFSIDELEGLLKGCRELSEELERFGQ